MLYYALFTEIAALIPIAILFMELDINKVWILIVALVMVATLYAEIAVKSQWVCSYEVQSAEERWSIYSDIF